MGKWYDDEVTQAILHKKYLHEGENSFDDLVNRVSSIYSEDIREEVKTALYNADLSPAGRTLYAAGMKNSNKKLSCSNCFTAGMKVNTTEGLKNIEDINVDDLVVTETGVHPVEAVSVRPYRGDLYKISGRGLYDDIVCTPNHKFLTYDGWKRADRLFTSSEIKGEHAKGCCSKLRISNIYKVDKHYDTVDLSKITLMDNNSEIIINDNNTLSVGVHISSKFYKPFMHKFGKVVNRYIELDEDFRYFIGRWLGDGSVTTRRGKKSPSILQIVFNATTEREAAQRIINIGTRVFGFSPAVRETEQNVIAVRFENPIIATWFYSEFGRGCDGKYLPDKYLGDMQIAYGLFDSDGLLTSHGTLSITLKNIKLITWLKDTLYMNGIICNSIKATEHKDTYKLTLPTSVSKKYINPKLTKTYHDCRENISIGFDRYVDYIKVENIEILEDVNTTVYNLQIADDHTYNVNGVVVHNCYIVTSPLDDLESINATDYEMSKIGSMGGGVGVALDHIRPKGSKINNSARYSDGVAFCLHKYNQTGELIGQSSRHMAMMVMLDCKHPDIEEFLHIKANGEKLSAMNISIKFHEDFFEAVEQNKDYELYFKVESTGEEIKRTINARQFFEEFCKVNADWGEPGICYIDRVRDYHLLSGYPEYIIETSNPCSEFFGIAGNSCNLGSINLYNIVDDKFTDNAHINYEKFEKLIRLGVNVLDQTLDYGYEMQPLDMNRTCIDDWRSIGLGVFGLADMFIAMKIKYGSEESLKVMSELFDFMNIIALDESSNLAEQKGTFGKYDWEKQKKSPIIQALKFNNIDLYNKIERTGLRNGTLIVIAPTGTLSLFMGRFSGGVEPLFKCGYDRTTHAGEDKHVVFRVFAHSIEDLLKYNNLPLTLSNEEIKEKFDWVVESQDIEPLMRIAVQSVMQDYVDGSISSTINLPHDTSWKTIFDIYMQGWKQKLKGLTVFVDGCKRGNLLGVDTSKKETKEEPVYDTVVPVSRRGVQEVSGSTFRLKTACVDKFYIHINKTDEGELFEIFANPSSGCQSNIGTITRLVSMALRSGIKVSEIIKELRSMKCPACQALRARGEKDIELSCGNAIAHALEMAYNKKLEKEDTSGLLECPECHQKTLRPEGKCFTCNNCSYSRCD